MKYGPWEIFNGGDCPLKKGERAQVQLVRDTRSEAKSNPVCFDFDWNLAGNDADIIAFRRVIEPRPVALEMHVSGSIGNICHGRSHKSANRNFTITVTGDDIKVEWVK